MTEASGAPRPLSELRSELDAVDADLIAAIARRQALVAEIGRWKHAQGKQLRDFQREREVIAHVRQRAEKAGLDPAIAEQVMKLLIESSLTTQEQDRVRLAGQGGGRRALVIGGNGRMGRWFVRFLAAQGFDVEVADPTGAPEGVAGRDDWKDGALDQDLIVVAAPGGSGAPLGLLGRLPGFASRVLPRLATRDLLRRYLARAQASSSSSIAEGALALYWDRLARPGGVEAAMAMLGHLGEPGLGERLAALRRRALVVWGSDDRLCPLVGGRRLADALGAHLVVLDRCGHLPAEEAPEALVECVDAFLAEAAPRAP